MLDTVSTETETPAPVAKPKRGAALIKHRRKNVFIKSIREREFVEFNLPDLHGSFLVVPADDFETETGVKTNPEHEVVCVLDVVPKIAGVRTGPYVIVSFMVPDDDDESETSWRWNLHLFEWANRRKQECFHVIAEKKGDKWTSYNANACDVSAYRHKPAFRGWGF
jgi:hypothetical protein